MKELYVLAHFDRETGEFIDYVRKGRNDAISGYDDLSAARRGLSQSKRSWRSKTYDLYIVKSIENVIIKEDDE